MQYYNSEFGEPLYNFGHGLSLAPFTLAWATPPPSKPTVISLAVNTTIAVTVKNMGGREGDCVVMLYHCPKGNNTFADDGEDSSGSPLALDVEATMPVPNMRLVGYSRVRLEAGSDTTVTFSVGAEQLGLVDENGDTQVQPVR